MSTQSKLDELISWYKKFKPSAGKKIRVYILRSTARRFSKSEEVGGPLIYRGVEIETREQWMNENEEHPI